MKLPVFVLFLPCFIFPMMQPSEHPFSPRNHSVAQIHNPEVVVVNFDIDSKYEEARNSDEQQKRIRKQTKRDRELKIKIALIAGGSSMASAGITALVAYYSCNCRGS